MNEQTLIDIAKTLVADDKGLLAMDESNPTCNKRFARLGIPQTVEALRAYRQLIVTTLRLGECVSGVIPYDETIRQQKKDATALVKVITDAGIIPGIKVDIGAKDMAAHPREKITEGLDGLRTRLKEYFQMGARFAKWRAVIAIGHGIPSRGCIKANAQALARYAAGFGNLAGPAGQCPSGAGSSLPSSQVQLGCAPWRIQCRDGSEIDKHPATRKSHSLIRNVYTL